MPVHEYFTAMFRGAAEAAAGGGTDEEREARVQRFMDDHRRIGDGWDTAGVAIADTAVPGPHGPVPVRTYRPEGGLAGAILWAHGGGFRHGDLDMPEGHIVAVELARRARALVVSVDYRLADGATVLYPVPIDDVHAAWTWLAAQGEFAALPLGLGGASAGAALAVSTALRARDAGPRPADALLLAYPFAHYPNPPLDWNLYPEMAEVPARFDPAGVEGMVRNYVGRISDVPADALPGAARLDGLPPTRIVVSEYDDLRSSAELLARQLAELGVPVASYLAPGMTHGHLNHPPRLPAIDESITFLAKGLNG
ncbi:alpha/beta hydrolase fold domain-containing protein [Glycomyces endophyticus]|uniref:Alpha/beta hydrolase fold domain-containing protein n=1 Tax=Glycomyces endophyticus TaxID=480996 RepID=A0ABP4TGP0_9ACTN